MNEQSKKIASDGSWIFGKSQPPTEEKIKKNELLKRPAVFLEFIRKIHGKRQKQRSKLLFYSSRELGFFELPWRKKK